MLAIILQHLEFSSKLGYLVWKQNHHLNTPVRSVSTVPINDPASPKPRHKILLETASGEVTEYDHVIMACHTDATLDILRRGKGMTEQEEKLLSAFRWNSNTAVLHSDPRVR